MRYLVVIPARGGSKGIPLKNIYPINRKELILYTLEMLNNVSLNQMDIAISTDSEEIKKVVKHSGVDIINRPTEISGDNASTEDALLHALDEMEKRYSCVYDAVITLQPTSPFRKTETMLDMINEFEKEMQSVDALISLTENRTDFWVKNGDSFERMNKNAPRRRQDRKPIYAENSAYYITKTEALRRTHSVLGNSVKGYIIDEYEGLDINEPIDIAIAEAIIQGGFYGA